MIISWILFPLLIALLCLGGGLLVERASGARLPGVLLLPLGFALIVCLTQVATEWDATAELAMPLVLVAAIAGLVLGIERLRAMRPEYPAAIAAVAVFAVFAAPVVLSGSATFSGYNLLGESSIHFIGVDRLMDHGRDLSGLKPSSYEYCLQQFFGNGYPSGSDTALGSVRTAGGTGRGLGVPALHSDRDGDGRALPVLARIGHGGLPMAARGGSLHCGTARARVRLRAPGQRQGASRPSG